MSEPATPVGASDDSPSGGTTQVVESGTPAPQGLASAPASGGSISRTRLILVDVMIGITTVLAVVGMFAVYANRLLFNPDNWAKTSTQLLENDTIRSTTANYIVQQ